MSLIPQHLAIVMDGNGRWAQQRHLPRVAGHRAGVHAVRRTITACMEQRIPVLSLFAFSSENWQRPPAEVVFLMDLLLLTLRKEIKELHDNNIRLTVIGDKTALNLKLQDAICAAEQLTANNTGLRLVIAINYGGTWDIVQAARRLAALAVEQQLAWQHIDLATLTQQLSTADLPAVDLLIRTSGEQRLSNFFLLQAAYAELYFTDILWPDFTAQDIHLALEAFTQRQRRYGAIPEMSEVNSA